MVVDDRGVRSLHLLGADVAEHLRVWAASKRTYPLL